MIVVRGAPGERCGGELGEGGPRVAVVEREEIYVAALKALRGAITAARRPVGPENEAERVR